MALKARLAANDASIIDARGTSTPLPLIDLSLQSTGWLLHQFVGHIALPGYGVPTQTGAMPIWVADRRLVTTKRDAQGKFVSIVRKVSGTKYSCDEAGLINPVSDDAMKTYKTKDDAYLHAAQQTALSLLTAREASIAALLENTGTYGAGNFTAAAAFWSIDTTDVLKELNGIIEDKATQLGVDPSALNVQIPAKAWKALKNNATVRAAISSFFNGAGVNSLNINEAQVAQILGVGRVIIARAQKDTGNPNKTSSFTGIWDRTKVLIYLPSTAQYEMLALGKTFTWEAGMERSALSQAMDLPALPELFFNAEMYRDEERTADVVRLRHYEQQVVTNGDAGFLLTGVVASNYV